MLNQRHQVTQRFLLAAGYPHRDQPADHQQPHEALSVTAIGLDPVLRRTLDLPRRRDHTPDPGRDQRPREPEPSDRLIPRRPSGREHPRLAPRRGGGHQAVWGRWRRRL